ncbi:MAG: hypothetical protein C0392_01340 [Syntrophus sp. (in: bacteria)]|nr:hypothetical protein [Syntrophus sp. (in: bacteria)]
MALAKMRRVYLVGPVDQKEKTMKFLQERGVVHIEPVVKLTGESEKEFAIIQQQARKIGQVCEGVSRYKGETDKMPAQVPDDQLVSFCESRLADLQEIKGRKQILRKMIKELQIWGDFDPDRLRDFEKEGVFIQRFHVEGKLAADFSFPDDVYIEMVSRKPFLNFFTVNIDGPVQIHQAIPLKYPEIGLRKAQEELVQLQEKEKRLIRECAGAFDRIEVLKGQYNVILNKASFAEHCGVILSEEHLFGLQGWIPANTEDGFIKEIKSSKLPVMATTRDPLDDEIPPTLFKNNWFIRQIEPLLKLYGLPAYRSIDPSYFFAPFMILFFGICLGDAGYGLVFLLLSTWLKKKWRWRGETFSLAMTLCQAFSISTIIIGLLTGSVFGYNFENRNWILMDLDIDKGNPMILFYVSLGLGVLHLSLSYLLGMFDAKTRYDVLQRLGIMLVLWGGVFLVSRNIWFFNPASLFNMPFNYAGWGVLALGLLLTFFFASDSTSWGVRIGLGFWGIYGLTGLIGDLLSYARLFGLGIATAAIAAVMNQLAGRVHDAAGPVVGGALALFLLIIGHAFNLALSILGSTVHSARLHFVEAFRSFFQGGGVQYKPFKIKRG